MHGSEDASAAAHDKAKGGVLTFLNQRSGERVHVLVKSYNFFDPCAKSFPDYPDLRASSLVLDSFDQTCTSAVEFKSAYGVDVDFVFYAKGEGADVWRVPREEDKILCKSKSCR